MPTPLAHLRHLARTGALGACAAAVAMLGLAGMASAQYGRPDTGDLKPANDPTLEEGRAKAAVTEHVGDVLPKDLTFTDSNGQTVTLGDVLDGEKPVILQMAYYRCPQLCGEVMNGMVRSMLALDGQLAIGDDFEVITVSFDSRESSQLAKTNLDAIVDAMSGTFDADDVRQGWHFWTGDDGNIQKLADAIGFGFAWVPEANEYSHQAVIVLLDPNGKISRYLYGTTYNPQTLRLSVVNASKGSLQPSWGDAFVYYCFAYDPTTGKYTATARTVMMIGGGVTAVTLACVLGFLFLAERKGRRFRHPNAGTPEPEPTLQRPHGAFSDDRSE